MKILIQEQGFLGHLADVLVTPIMYFVSGTFSETPQRTHVWNNQKFGHQVLSELDTSQMVFVDGDPEACPRGLIRFHLPIMGGWREYIVVEPVRFPAHGWHVGWNCGITGISRIRLHTRVRLLVGPGDSRIFGIDCFGRQIPLKEIGRGIIGQRDRFCTEPLL